MEKKETKEGRKTLVGIVNGQKGFIINKRKTKPLVKVPKNVRDTLNIDEAYPDGIFKIEPEKGVKIYDVCYIFEDINYINQDDKNKESILLQIVGWLKSMSTDFKIGLVNEYRDMNKFIEEVFVDTNRNEYPVIAEGMQQWIKEKIKDGNPDINKLRYLIISCKAQNHEEAQIYFNNLDMQLNALFTSWKSNLYKLQKKDRIRSLFSFFHPKEEWSYPVENEEREENKLTDDWKNNVLPTSIRQEYNFLIADNLYISVLFASRYATALDEGKVIPHLSGLPFPSIVTMDYAPISKNALNDKLSADYMNNEKAISNEINRKRQGGNLLTGISYRKSKIKEELESYKEQVSDNDEKCFYFGLLVVITADTEEELAQRVDMAINLGREDGVTLETYNIRQLKALQTALPYAGRQVNVMRPILSSSIVAFQPYFAQDIMEFGGFVYGTNRTTKRLVIGNRKRLLNPHGMIVGHTGSGKSMLIKETEISQTLLSTNDDIFVIDPQNEYGEFCIKYGGQFINVKPKGADHYNPFEIPEEVWNADDSIIASFVADKEEYACAFVEAAMTNMIVTREYKSKISHAVREMYAECFSRKILKNQPTWKQLRKKIKENLEAAKNENDQMLFRKIYNSLEDFTEGSFDVFSDISTTEITKRFVVFGLQEVSEQYWEAAMVTFMHILENRMQYNKQTKKATRMIVDETQVVCSHEASAAMLLKASVTFRKRGGICTFALQNLTRALENPELRDMFSNCAYKCFLDQGGVDAINLAQVQKLSPSEFESLNEEKPGHMVMVWGKKIVLLNAHLSKENVLYKDFSTNYHEAAIGLQGKENKIVKAVQSNEKDMEDILTDKEKMILDMAAISSITLKDVILVTGMSDRKAKETLEKMCEKQILEASTITGITQYQKGKMEL